MAATAYCGKNASIQVGGCTYTDVSNWVYNRAANEIELNIQDGATFNEVITCKQSGTVTVTMNTPIPSMEAGDTATLVLNAVAQTITCNSRCTAENLTTPGEGLIGWEYTFRLSGTPQYT